MKKHKSNNKTNNKKRNKLIAKNQDQLLFHKVKFLEIILVADMLSKNLLIKSENKQQKIKIPEEFKNNIILFKTATNKTQIPI